MKAFYIISGVFFLMLGFIGLMIPVIPQVPFLLSGVFLVSKGSERFERKIKSTRIYKEYISKLKFQLDLHRVLKTVLKALWVITVFIAVVYFAVFFMGYNVF